MPTGISGLYKNTKGAKIARGEKIKQTHFDRIKAMSVEEMAEFLKRVCIGKEVEWTMGGILRYLESEVQEDE